MERGRGRRTGTGRGRESKFDCNSESVRGGHREAQEEKRMIVNNIEIHCHLCMKTTEMH
jgi:hypothetical protein